MNRLGAETSPYLRQHADNPVDWHPWDDQALALAVETDRPILLSIGYSACHWCHVMAHESFEDPATAAVMNEHFISIKVDREERPDVDAIYMDAVQTLTGHGGWPLTVFLMPDTQPFFGGTYYPNEPRHGMPSFVQVLEGIAKVWHERRADVATQAGELTTSLRRTAELRPIDAPPSPGLLGEAATALGRSYDSTWGGFGSAPKFPQTMNLDALLRSHLHSGATDVLAMVTTTLDAMALGGIYDHLGGGFSRYSVDREWTVPHFEKMLYDNALFVRVYLHAWQITGQARYLQVVDETISYVLRDLRDPSGGFYSAEDADSEGVEGKFYVWSPQQIHAVLGDDSAEFINWFEVTEEGNFEGRSILRRPLGGELSRPASIELSRQRLFQAREMRIRPGLDNKVLAEWNGLMLASLSEAALVTSNQQWLGVAIKNGEFLLDGLRRDDGRWLRSWQAGDDGGPGVAKHLAYAADLAALVDGFTRLAEASGQARWITVASETADQLLDLYWDDDQGGVYTTGSDAPELIARPKDITDNALPGANGATAVAFLRLSALTGNQRYTERAEAIMTLLGSVAQRHPESFGHLLAAFDMQTSGFTEVVIPGENEALLDVVRLRYLPNRVLAWGEPYDSPLWAGREKGNAYVCRDFTCALPATTTAELSTQLDDAAVL